MSERKEPLADLEITGRSMVRTGERTWKGVGEATVRSDAEGGFDFEVLCGSDLALSFEDWSWQLEPDHLLVEPGAEPMPIYLLPEREVLLHLRNPAGVLVEGSFLRSGSTEPLPVPRSGLLVEGLSWGKVSGILSAEGLPDRAWKLNRSDELHEPAPDKFEAIVMLGEELPVWVSFEARDHRRVAGVWCVESDARGEVCKLNHGAWYCPCVGVSAVVIGSDRWDGTILRPTSGSELQVGALPQPLRQCFSFSGSGRLSVRPPGVRGDALTAVTVPLPDRSAGGSRRGCVNLAAGESLEAVAGEIRVLFVTTGDVDVIVPGSQ